MAAASRLIRAISAGPVGSAVRQRVADKRGLPKHDPGGTVRRLMSSVDSTASFSTQYSTHLPRMPSLVVGVGRGGAQTAVCKRLLLQPKLTKPLGNDVLV
jgi:hypothetical protein